MKKKLFFGLAALLISPGLIFAEGTVKAMPAGCEPAQTELFAKTGKEFLSAVKKIVSKSGSSEAAALLKLAEVSAEESEGFIAEGDSESARKLRSDSIQSAIHAVIVSNNPDSGLRNRMIEEDLILRERHEKEQKKNKFEKSAPEVEIFIKTAERLLKNNANPEAEKKLDETKRIYKSSMDKALEDDYEGALVGMTQAYRMATSIVKAIKNAQGDIITFPKAASADEKEILSYEIKKNEAYVSFAADIAAGSNGANSLFSEALVAREAAKTALASGENSKAIENLKRSTGLFIKAIRYSRD